MTRPGSLCSALPGALSHHVRRVIWSFLREMDQFLPGDLLVERASQRPWIRRRGAVKTVKDVTFRLCPRLATQARLGGVVSSEGHVQPPANADVPFPGLWTHYLHF